MPRTTAPRRTAALVGATLLLAALTALGVAARPAGAACAAQNRSIGGNFLGEDGRQVAGLVGIVLLDAGGGYIGLDGCPRAPGYASHVFVNLDQHGAFTLGTNGATSGYQSTWRIDGIPANAVSAWVEGYPKSNTPDTTGYYPDWTDYRRYGGAMRRGVPIGTNVHLTLPLNCEAGGDNGVISATVTRGGAAASVASAWAFSLAPEHAGQILGFVTSEETGAGHFTIRALEPNQNYALQINLTNGASYWFENNYGVGVPVQPCTTTTRSFVLDDASGRAIATGGGFESPGLGVADMGGQRSVYTRAVDGSVSQRIDVAGAGTSPSLGGRILGDPDATSWGPGATDVVVRGADNAVYWRGFRNGGWMPWQSLGGGTSYSPSIVSWGPNRLDVVVTGTDGQLWHRQSGNGGASWSGWAPLGGRLTSAPDVAAWGYNRLDIAARGQDGQLWHLAWGGTAWGPWEGLGGRMLGGPAAVGPAPGQLELLVVGTDRVIYSMRWNGSAWTGYASTGGATYGDPDAAAYGGSTSIYARGVDGRVWRATRSAPGAGLTGWSSL